MTRIYKAFIFFLTLPLVLYPQSQDIKFEHISNEQGLSSAHVRCILQDSKGFMWFGTADGLNKYDGYTFTVYRNDPEDAFSLSDNQIRAIHKDPSGLIWIGTGGGGLNCFNPETEHFTVYQYIKDTPSINTSPIKYVQGVSGFQYGEQYIVWIGTSYGLYKFNTVTHKFTCYPPTDQEWPNNLIKELIVNRSGNVWVGIAGSGLYYFDAETEQYIHYQHDPANPKSISNNFIHSLYEDRSGILWIGTSEGLNQLDPETGEFTRYYHDPANPNSLRGNSILSLYEDSKGLIWIGTSEGFHQFNPKKGHFIRYYHDPRIPESISNNYISAIYEDRSGVIWVGTGTGLNRILPQKAQFKHYWQDPSNPKSLYNKSVNSVYETRYGGKEFLWIGTEHNGIYKINRETGYIVNYRHDANNPNSLSHNMACVEIQSRFNGKDELWIRSYHGLNRLDPKTGQFTHYFHDPEDPNSINGNTIEDIFEDREGVLWISTLKGGLQTLYRTTGQFTSVGPKSDIIQIYEDKSGKIWIASWGGLRKFDRKTGQFTRYRKDHDDKTSISSEQIMCLYESSYEGRDILWIGTNDGLNNFDPESEIFTHYKAKDGLPSEIIQGILEDNKGNLWLSTDNGLSRFNPKTETFRNYDVNDGLLSNQFIRGACYKSKDGEMFFGNSKGFDAFYPDSLKDNRHIPAIVLTNFQLFNKPVNIIKIGITDSVDVYTLPKQISALEEIELSYKENIFSFEFAALDYRSPEKNQYAFMMEGFESDWNYTDAKRRFATYTNLDPGEYIYRVKGSNNDGLWNEEGTFIKIIITPPWWRTNLAYGSYFILLCALLYALRKYDLKRQRLKHELELEHLHSEKLVEVDRMKSRFFANISHEFRTPLTLIKGPLEQLLNEEFRGNIKELYTMMLRNSRRLLNLINQILDLSKLESGQMKLQASRIDVIKLLKGFVLSFCSLAESKNITLKFEAAEKSLDGYIDRDKVEKIITNLLSNAFKFTPDGGRIEVAVGSSSGSSKGEAFPGKILNESNAMSRNASPQQFPIPNSEFVEITISNTGPGIPSDQLDKIFDRFYQTDTTYKKDGEGSGIGLALTKELVELHRGTIEVNSGLERHPPQSPLARGEASLITFTILLPIGIENFKEEEIIEAPAIEEPQTKFPPIKGVTPKGGSAHRRRLRGVSESEPTSSIQDPRQTTSPSRRPVGMKSSKISHASSILIVEDNPDVTSYISSFMKNDYQIITAENGKEGLKKVLDKFPDLIISDVMMPEMDGFELCQKIKSDERISHIPVILLTAKADLDSKIDGLEFGADDYVTKPFEARELQIRSKNLIEQRRKLREKFSHLIDLQPEDIAASSMDEQLLERLLAVFENHIEEPGFGVENLAREVGISRTHLNRKLQALTNLSTSDFIRTLRLQRAAQMLSKASGTVSEIAYKVGFNNLSHFSKAFRKHFGKLPSDFSRYEK